MTAAITYLGMFHNTLKITIQCPRSQKNKTEAFVKEHILSVRIGRATAGRPARHEGHSHGCRPQHHQEREDGTRCLPLVLATYVPGENFFF